MDLDMLIYELIRKGDLSIGQLAKKLGVSENYLYKISLPEFNQNNANAPLRKIIAIAKHQKSKKLAEYVAQEFNGMFVTIPRSARDRRDENEIVNDYQRTTSRAVQMLMEYFEKPDEDNYNQLIKQLRDVMEKSEGIRRRAKKDGFKQMELFEN